MDESSPDALYKVLKYCYTGELPKDTHPELQQGLPHIALAIFR